MKNLLLLFQIVIYIKIENISRHGGTKNNYTYQFNAKREGFIPVTLLKKLDLIQKGIFDHFIVQINSIMTGYYKGELFIIIGKKK